MKVRMYRNYDKFPYESDHHGNFNGRMIFTFFRPISVSKLPIRQITPPPPARFSVMFSKLPIRQITYPRHADIY